MKLKPAPMRLDDPRAEAAFRKVWPRVKWEAFSPYGVIGRHEGFILRVITALRWEVVVNRAMTFSVSADERADEETLAARLACIADEANAAYKHIHESMVSARKGEA